MREHNFNPDLRSLLNDENGNTKISRYSLVSATAKLARRLADEEAEKDVEDRSTEKPVSMALRKLLDKEYIIVETEEIKSTRE